MKKILITFLLVLLSHGPVTLAGTLSSEQKAIKSLIQKMYAIEPDTFEFATFGAKFKNGEEIVSGKLDHSRHCKLLAEFLVPEAVIPVKNKYAAKLGCMAGVDGFFRYPGFDSMDIGAATRTEPPPIPQINTPVVNGDKAKVYVTLDHGENSMYYLKKLPEGWRIQTVVSRERGSISEKIEDDDTIKIFPPETEDALELIKSARKLNAEWTSLPSGK